MGFWDDNHDSYQQVYDDDGRPKNESSFGHELLAGGASFAAFKVFEDRQRAEGKPVSHQFAKELLAGFAGAEVDKLAETKGMDFVDRERAKRRAEEQTQNMYEEHYERNLGADQYDPNQYGPPERIRQQFRNDY